MDVYNTDIDEQLGNKPIQFKKFYNEYHDSKDENISCETWMCKLLYIPFTRDYSPLQLGKIGEKNYKVFKFWSNTP